ncbi:MAG TPA: TfuA-like protein [Kiloniellales bacterium]
MTAVIFTGPTLSAEEGRAIYSAEFRPPASRGDVYRVARTAPKAIGIVDGYFERVPSVWHKEILWAMSQGIHVFGSGSIGALRAAELASFGMEGVGFVFEAFRDGRLEDDDEVAVEHGPVESGYLSTDAMVNIRVTLSAAVAAGIICEDASARLVSVAKSLFFKNRSYSRILGSAARDGLPASELDALRDWLPLGKVDQKKKDARAMLVAMKEFLDTNPMPKSVIYSFEHTTKWDALVNDETLDLPR